MTFLVRLARGAEDDLTRLHASRLETSGGDWELADGSVDAVAAALRSLETHPFAYRKFGDSPFLRELVVSFGTSGCVVLYEIDDDRTVTVLAVRHQLESDYH